MTDTPFDFESALKALQSGQPLTGKEGILTPLIKQLTEAALKAELEQHLESDPKPNRKNGSTRKTVKTTGGGSFELDTPRDRTNTFEPQLVKKHQTHMTDEIEFKILSMFGVGMSYQDISAQVAEIYGMSMSTASISAITEKLIPELKQWQQRQLNSHYPFVWLDVIHYKIKEDGRKDILSLYISEYEGANFWLSVLTDLQQRGVKDILTQQWMVLQAFLRRLTASFPTLKSSCVLSIKSVTQYAMWLPKIRKHLWLT